MGIYVQIIAHLQTVLLFALEMILESPSMRKGKGDGKNGCLFLS